MTPLEWVGWSALGVVVLTWLMIAFSQPSPRRAVVEWVSTCALYVTLLSLFGFLLVYKAANWFQMAAFGFFVVLFGIGLVLALVHLFRSFRGGEAAAESPTH